MKIAGPYDGERGWLSICCVDGRHLHVEVTQLQCVLLLEEFGRFVAAMVRERYAENG